VHREYTIQETPGISGEGGKAGDPTRKQETRGALSCRKNKTIRTYSMGGPGEPTYEKESDGLKRSVAHKKKVAQRHAAGQTGTAGKKKETINRDEQAFLGQFPEGPSVFFFSAWKRSRKAKHRAVLPSQIDDIIKNPDKDDNYFIECKTSRSSCNFGRRAY